MDIIDKDIKIAHTIEGDFYHLEKYFELSKEKIFAKSWQLISDESNLGSENSVKPVEYLESYISEPLVLIKQADHNVKCFSNICTHRGNILVNESCKLKEITCKYHGRRFNNKGEFVFMPEFKEALNFPSKKDNLKELKINKWKQFLFTSLNAAINFNSLISEMDKRIGWMPIEKFKLDLKTSKDYYVKANWALYCDNYLEGFHIPFVHEDLNKTIDYSQYQTEIYKYSSLQIANGSPNEMCFKLPEESPDFGKNIAAYYFWIYPNMMFNFYPWGLSINIVKPLKTNLTKVEFKSYVWDENKRQSGAGSILDKVEKEDEEIVENVQKGVKSRFYKNGRFSPKMEKGVHHFHKLISNFILT